AGRLGGRGRRRRSVLARRGHLPRRARQAPLERLELLVQVVGVLEALAAVLLVELGGGRLAGRQYGGRDRGRAGRARRALHLEQRLAVVAPERQLTGQHLEEEDAERVEVALGGRLLAPGLLGRHVLGRSEHGALRREARVHRQVGEPEVED